VLDGGAVVVVVGGTVVGATRAVVVGDGSRARDGGRAVVVVLAGAGAVLGTCTRRERLSGDAVAKGSTGTPSSATRM